MSKHTESLERQIVELESEVVELHKQLRSAVAALRVSKAHSIKKQIAVVEHRIRERHQWLAEERV